MAKPNAPRQVAALPVRKDPGGAPEILLVTSREAGRWIVPKGWRPAGLSPSEAAAREAFEEAGVRGEIGRRPIGSYRYLKRRRGRFDLIDVQVHLLLVREELADWPERSQRLVRWTSPDAAAAAVREPELAALILRLKTGELFTGGALTRVVRTLSRAFRPTGRETGAKDPSSPGP